MQSVFRTIISLVLYHVRTKSLPVFYLIALKGFSLTLLLLTNSLLLKIEFGCLYMINELINDWSRNKKDDLVLKFDLEKAFDTMNWGFLDVIPYIKGFNNIWRSWIRGCISNVNFSIIINGRFKCKIIPSVSIRGCSCFDHRWPVH